LYRFAAIGAALLYFRRRHQPKNGAGTFKRSAAAAAQWRHRRSGGRCERQAAQSTQIAAIFVVDDHRAFLAGIIMDPSVISALAAAGRSIFLASSATRVAPSSNRFRLGDFENEGPRV
jgi:hypothetical protein